MNRNEETREFQAEVKQLLDIVINSLYTDREIFLRELISNAADALEKVRYLKLTNKDILQHDLPLEISISTDDVAQTVTIADTGVGMTKDELVENLGTIAHSGSKAFIKRLAEGDKNDLNLIGQFGVGFYSAFMVADKVTLYTRSYKKDSKGYTWVSDGSGSYTISKADNLDRGTKIVLHLKKDATEFAKMDIIKRIIKQYSGFVPFPIKVNGEVVNTIKALWTKNKNEISEEEYTEFYKYIANSADEPLYRLHFTADAPLSIRALLFVPQDNLERFGFGQVDPGVNVYYKKVLLQQQSEDILPEWLRFLKGVIDSEELPLNISRETMQDSALVARLRRVITSRFIKFLDEQSKRDREKYKEFWEKFGMFIKEGVANDFTHRDELVKLLRFESSKSEKDELISLKEYVERIPEEQKEIYYISGPSREAIESSPYLEIFNKKDIEVLYATEAIDDYIFAQLKEFEGKKFVSAEGADLKLPEGEETTGDRLPKEEAEAFTDWLKKVLGERVLEVRESRRLVDSPAVVLNPGGMTSNMQRMMQIINKDLKTVGPKILEVNTAHKLIKKLNTLRKQDAEFAKIAAEQIFDNALVSAGLLMDPRDMVGRIYDILERAL